MSYRLIDSNAIAIKYPEVNEMPCVFANLPDGMNGQFIDVQPEVLACGNGELIAQPEPQEGHWINGKCDLCGEHAPFWCMASTYHESNYCPRCGARMKGAEHETD